MKTYGLIGYPLTHSFSAEYFWKKFKMGGIIDYEYKFFPLSSIEELPSLLESNKTLWGLNVTIPYKQTVLKFLDELDEPVEKIKAVNTIKIFRYKNRLVLKGYNTDAYGFEESLKTLLKPFHKNAIILGTGGAAQAVWYVLNSQNFICKFVSRNKTSLENVIGYSSLTKELISEVSLIVNATPVGMFPDVNSCPDIPYEHITRQHILYDLVYNPPVSLFLKKGKENGAQIKNGHEMLHLQAEKSWRIWRGIDSH